MEYRTNHTGTPSRGMPVCAENASSQPSGLAPASEVPGAITDHALTAWLSNEGVSDANITKLVGAGFETRRMFSLILEQDCRDIGITPLAQARLVLGLRGTSNARPVQVGDHVVSAPGARSPPSHRATPAPFQDTNSQL